MVAFDPWGWAAFGPLKWTAVSTLTLASLALLLTNGPVVVHRAAM